MLFGPTAVGKTELLRDLPLEGAEVISADSMQVYRYMDIGTAKPAAELRASIPHHLIDVVEPDRQFNAGRFVREAERLAAEIQERGGRPLVCGGTAYYLRSLVCGLAEAPPGEAAVREQLKAELRERGLARLFQELSRVDPATAAALHPNDSYRVVRALEVYRSSGRPLSAFRNPRTVREDFDFLLIGVHREREELYRRIAERVERMFRLGLVGEVKSLIRRGYGREDPGMRGIGYREFFEMQKGCLSLRDVQEKVTVDSRRYAKRQLTFMRSLPGVIWYRPEEVEKIRARVRTFWEQHSRPT